MKFGQLLVLGSGCILVSNIYSSRENLPNDHLTRSRSRVPIMPEVGYSTSMLDDVMEFLEGSRRCGFVQDVSAFRNVKRMAPSEEHFTEHNPSVTIYVNDDEWCLSLILSTKLGDCRRSVFLAEK